MNAPQDPELRYERKFLAPGPDPDFTARRLALTPARFARAHPPRWVNSVYLDTASLALWEEGVEGAPERTKIRVRWYGALFGEIPSPVLEVKTKFGHVGTKARTPLPPAAFSPGMTAQAFLSRLLENPSPGLRARVLPCRPVVLVRYCRMYLESADRRFRATLDTEIACHAFDRMAARRALVPPDPRRVVLEVKYAPEHDPEARRLLAPLPLRLDRSSKYLWAVQTLYGALS
ncbi:MAG: VTC domain-containing protein [Pseudomonadota bacterium]